MRITEDEIRAYGLKSIKDAPRGEEGRKDTNWYLARARDGGLVKMRNPASTYRYQSKDGTIWVKQPEKEYLEGKKKEGKGKDLWK